VSPPGNATAPIQEIITDMYTPGPSQNENIVVSAWDDNTKPNQQAMYRDVIARSCRGCHASSSFPKLNFNKPSNFLVSDVDGAAKLYPAEVRICVDHVMPHSKVTHRLYWTSVNPNQPSLFHLFGDTQGVALPLWDPTLSCPVYVAGGTTPISPFVTDVQPIFSTKCAICHIGSSAPPTCKHMDLSTGNSRGNIVGVSAGELPSMNRVTAGDHTQSFLWHKIDGSQGTLGANNSCGPGNSQMPLGGSLTPAQISAIQTWIDGGANP